MTDDPTPGMIGEPPSARYPAIPADPAEHAQRSAREWQDVIEPYIQRRMKDLGVPKDKQGADDLRPYMQRCTFDPQGRDGGSITSGITVNSGVLNPELLKGQKGGRIWPKARLRDRIDAIIAHEWAESRTVDHVAALKDAARTELPVTDGARRILRAMAR